MTVDYTPADLKKQGKRRLSSNSKGINPMLTFLELVPYMIVFIFGIVIGSFLNVCIYRLPLGESVVSAPSHCMGCGGKLRWFDMVPVFSWDRVGREVSVL